MAAILKTVRLCRWTEKVKISFLPPCLALGDLLACSNPRISHVAAKAHVAYSVYVQELAVWSLSWEASTKNECFSLHLLQVSALYLIFALPFITVADGISYLTRIRTHSSCQKCLKNLYRPRVSLQNGHFILIHKSFLLWKFPTIQYMPYSLIHLEPLETHNIVPNMSFIQRFHYN